MARFEVIYLHVSWIKKDPRTRKTFSRKDEHRYEVITDQNLPSFLSCEGCIHEIDFQIYSTTCDSAWPTNFPCQLAAEYVSDTRLSRLVCGNHGIFTLNNSGLARAAPSIRKRDSRTQAVRCTGFIVATNCLRTICDWLVEIWFD